MTSASVLFYNRRSRAGRDGFIDLEDEEEELDASSYNHRNSHQNNIRRQRQPNQQLTSRRDSHRLVSDGCDLLSRRAAHLGRHPPRRTANSVKGSESSLDQVRSQSHSVDVTNLQRGSARQGSESSLDQGRSQSHSGDVTNLQHGSARQVRRFIGHERLPNAVLLARERLIQRLRGASLSGDRQDNRDPLSTRHDDWTSEEGGLRFIDADHSDTVIIRERFAGTLPFTDHLPLEKSTRPPALTKEAMNSLQMEIFRKSDTHDADIIMHRVSQDCSICLDNFREGDKLMRLPCGHRFHYHCLCRWLQICGDCPNCRTVILLTT